ncbi:conserved hypothetical protein [Pediculus humanus corporis]|uniref:Peptidase M14 domain-containing protein n=1 Tax=Pediculus humanus subsp. corporis TaxID=121224 RepID=E0VBM5_PEDHC|nr:uncharacterized protein Phum_PHUM065360 [Pediculus humanus corporis]EEB10781.1 conserved hypothetical protein [Pediculus humanus corporis]
MGNLNRLIVRPPGHSGKAKRGHLCFDASFETGNLGKVELISEFEYDLFIRPDTCNPKSRLWFNFSVDNTKSDQRVIFNIVNFSKRKSLFELGMTPIIKSSSRPKWQRIPKKYIYYYKSPDHNGQTVLSICHGFDKEEDIYQFAYSFPFSYSKCQAHLKQIEQKKYSFIKREILTKSIQMRAIDMLTISNIESNKKQRIVFILGRINPGDSPTSFVCQGILDFLISNHPIAVKLRNVATFKIVPMMNPDGVFLGNHRSNLMGSDLNRNWHQHNEWSHPSLYAFNQLVLDLESNKGVNVDFILDLHASSSLPGVFIYGNTYDDVYKYERHTVFPKLLAQNVEDYESDNTMYNRDAFKLGPPRRYFNSKLKGGTNCYTIEVSFFGYKKKDAFNYKDNQIKDWVEI